MITNEHSITCFCVDCEHNKNEHCELKSISLDYVKEQYFKEKWAAACNNYQPRESEEE